LDELWLAFGLDGHGNVAATSFAAVVFSSSSVFPCFKLPDEPDTGVHESIFALK
jgi:hypothetical protein